MIPAFLNAEAERQLGEHTRQHCSITGCTPVSGGCINSCYRLETTAGKYFLKFNDAGKYPGMFRVEAFGLQMLRKANAIPVPGVIHCGEINGLSFLILDWIESGKRTGKFWAEFGRGLARLHSSSSDNFGLPENNYIGSLPQSNFQRPGWIEFFIQERLEPQVRLAANRGALSGPTVKMFIKLFGRLGELIPAEKPALLHGDLWNGNFLVNQAGSASLIDPAVYFGHREMDLAMTKLFGGFDGDFYAAYQETFPLQKGFQTRVEIHNLYPLLVHVNLFGGGYVQQVRSVLERFV